MSPADLEDALICCNDDEEAEISHDTNGDGPRQNKNASEANNGTHDTGRKTANGNGSTAAISARHKHRSTSDVPARTKARHVHRTDPSSAVEAVDESDVLEEAEIEVDAQRTDEGLMSAPIAIPQEEKDIRRRDSLDSFAPSSVDSVGSWQMVDKSSPSAIPAEATTSVFGRRGGKGCWRASFLFRAWRLHPVSSNFTPPHLCLQTKEPATARP